MTINFERTAIQFDLATLEYEDVCDLKTIPSMDIVLTVRRTPMSIGALCYLRRRSKRRCVSLGCTYFVEPQSLSHYRCELTQKLLHWFIEQRETVHRQSTAYSYLSMWMRFINWSDTQKCDELKSPNDVIEVFNDYAAWLHQRHRNNKVKISTVTTYLELLRTMLVAILPEKFSYDLHSTYRLSRNLFKPASAIPPTSAEAASFLQTLGEIIALSLDMITRNSPYPFKGKMGQHDVCVMPLPYRPMRYISDEKRHILELKSQSKIYSNFNFTECRIATVEEIIATLDKYRSTPLKKYKAVARRNDTIARIKAFNADAWSKPRIRFINIYLWSNALLFIISTGINPSQAYNLKFENLEWLNDDIFIAHNIKPRAGEKHVKFPAGKGYTRYYKKYLDNRKRILGLLSLESPKEIFFQAGKNETQLLDSNGYNHFCKQLSSVFGVKKNILPGQWRVFKNINIVNDYGPIRAANMLQNKIQTNLSRYTNLSEGEIASELSSFFSNYETQLITSDLEDTDEIPIGHCYSLDLPENISMNPVAIANCRDFAGCLFCKNFRVHSDADDIFKLLSYKYVFELTQSLREIDSVERTRHQHIRDRIEAIVHKIIDHGGVERTDAEQVRARVYEQNELTNYWNNKVEMLADLEII